MKKDEKEKKEEKVVKGTKTKAKKTTTKEQSLRFVIYARKSTDM